MAEYNREQELLDAFNAKFGQKITDVTVVKRLLGSPHVQKWYKEFRAEQSQSSSLPEQWEKAGLTPAQWSEAAPVRAAIRSVRAATASEIATEARRFQDALARIEKRAQAEIAPLETPLVRIVNSGFNDLPLEQQIAVEIGPADKRKERIDAQMLAWRRRAITALNAKENPFRDKQRV